MMLQEQKSSEPVSIYDPTAHYSTPPGPVHEFGDVDECPPTIRNVGWTMGNDCPYRCHHCYSKSARFRGQDLSVAIVDRIVKQLADNHVETVNLGGNEPLFTNGLDVRHTLLPYVIEQLAGAGIAVGLTTSGITLLHLYEHYRHAFDLMNDVDVSLDSPFEQEHNANRGANLYRQAIAALKICQQENKPHTIIMAGMKWNFTQRHLANLVEMAHRLQANIRINPVKPVEAHHLRVTLSYEMYYAGFAFLLDHCHSIDLGEPPLAAVTQKIGAKRCPCGRTSFRINSITPDGHVYISPCVYLHDYKAPLDLLEYNLIDIIHSPQFRVFRQRNQHPELIEACVGCELLALCGGGCAARSYLHHVHETGERSLRKQDPYCPKGMSQQHCFPQAALPDGHHQLVHMDYLCTWIGVPKSPHHLYDG